MKKLIPALLALALSIPVLAFAQASTQEDKNTQAQQNQAAQVDSMGGTTLPSHTMTGTVSNAGSNFTSGDKTYMVSNPKSLKNYSDQSVTVVFKYDADNNKIRIVKVNPGQ
jgi:hypothetical protein